MKQLDLGTVCTFVLVREGAAYWFLTATKSLAVSDFLGWSARKSTVHPIESDALC